MPFDEDPRDNIKSYPCECGGNIELVDGKWSCDKCGDAIIVLNNKINKLVRLCREMITTTYEHLNHLDCKRFFEPDCKKPLLDRPMAGRYWMKELKQIIDE